MKVTRSAFAYLIFISLIGSCVQHSESSSQQSSPTESQLVQNNSSVVSTQNTANNADQATTSIKKVIKVGGWRLPDTSALSVNGAARTKRMLRIDNKSIQVYETRYKPNQETVIKADRNYLLDSKTLQVETEAWVISTIQKFEVNDRPFCYLLRGTLVSLDENDRVKSVLLSTTNLAYYDDDGDGSIEAFEYASVYPEMPSRIPKWASEAAK